jgi:hypothetical protein
MGEVVLDPGPRLDSQYVVVPIPPSHEITESRPKTMLPISYGDLGILEKGCACFCH